MKVLGTNEVGRGILIEHDGYISPNDTNNNRIINEALKNMDFSEDLILYAVLQKYGVPNKNGRIYPESILKRENEKYQTVIKKGGAMSELNHPSCHRGNVDVLTSDGWKNIKDIKEDEYVYTLNDKGFIELNKIYSSVKHQYSGKMIRLKGRNIDTSVTPNHKFPLIHNRNGKMTFLTAHEIFDGLKNGSYLGKYYIPKISKVIEKSSDDFVLKGCDESEFDIRAGEYIKLLYKQDVKIPMDVFASFMGIYLAEGHISSSSVKKRKSIMSNGDVSYYESSKHGYIVGISQKHKEKILLIEELLNLLPFKIKKYTKKDGTTTFIINDRRLWKYLFPLGKSTEKYIPSELKNLPPQYLDYLIKWFKLGDGRTTGKYNQSSVFSTSKRLILDLQEILIKTGKSGNIHEENRQYDRYIKDDNGKRLIKGKNSHNMWFLNFSKPNGIYLDSRFLNIEEEFIDDYVYSIDVPNHTYYVKDNDKCFWTGNSSLIDLDRVSHSIIETWWDGNILMGKLKLFTSPGWKKMGIVSCKGDQAAMLLMNGATLGISSRGVGSLKNIKGQNIVQDDFEIVCFDLVSSPSTPGAYIFSDPSERDQYAESEDKSLDQGLDKMKSLMNNLNQFLGK